MKITNIKPLILASFVTLSITYLSACKNTNNNAPVNNNNVKVKSEEGIAAPVTLAYINIDSMDAQFEFVKVNRELLKGEAEKAEAEIERMFKGYQNERLAAQKKAEAGTLTQSEYEQLGTKLQGMEQNIETKRNKSAKEMIDKQDKFQEQYQKYIDDFLAIYNKDNKYDFILSYSKASNQILHVNTAYDITADVVNGLNEAYAKEKSGK